MHQEELDGPPGVEMDAFAIWGDVCHLCAPDRRTGAVSFLIASDCGVPCFV